MNTHDHTKSLVRACLKGNANAQRQLYDQYIQAMFNVALRIVGNRADAEDVVQEAFINVFTQLSYFKGESTIGAWIKRITVNAALNNLRKRKRTVYVEETFNDSTEEPIKEDPVFKVQDIHHAIKKLPEKCRVVLTLHLIEGYQHKEIASILGISDSTSKSQYHRGKKILRSILKKNKNLSHVI